MATLDAVIVAVTGLAAITAIFTAQTATGADLYLVCIRPSSI